MKKALNTFTYNFEPDYFGQPASMDIRVIDQEGNPWFVAKDVATLLGYKYPAQVASKHCKYSESLKDLKGVAGLATLDLQPSIKLIPESDLYRLIMKSNMEEAERFQDWVCEEILPTIRKTGGTYMTDEALAKTLTDPDYLIGVLTKMKELKTERDYVIATKGQISEGMLASATLIQLFRVWGA